MFSLKQVKQSELSSVSTVRSLWRLLCCVWQLLWFLFKCAVLFPWLSHKQRMRQVGLFSSRALRSLDIDVRVQGLPEQGPVMLVANHISWLDILAINTVHTARFVSKTTVRQWPVLGWMVACGGTLFIERERKRDALRVVHQAAQALQEGHVIAFFPEGTTSDGHSLLPFHANLLQAAVAVNAPAQAIALQYRDTQHPISQAAIFVGDTTLVQSLWAIAKAQHLCVTLTLCEPQASVGKTRHQLSQQLRTQIETVLHDTRSKNTH
jgi:1-acyl-sn-glycerol-3-phosphate acyltransferase